MQYLLLLAHDPDAWPAEPTEPAEGAAPDWQVYTKALHDAGVLVGGAGLEALATATTVRVRDGRRLLTDGPFADTKEHLIGYYIIEVADLDAALDWAAKVPLIGTGSVEVRPVNPALTTDATLAAAGVIAAR